MATEVSNQKMDANNALLRDDANSINMSSGPNRTLCAGDGMVNGAELDQVIRDEPDVTTDEPSRTGMNHLSGTDDDGTMGSGGRGAGDGDAFGGGLGCCGREREDATSICRPASEGVEASIEVLGRETGVSAQDTDVGGPEVGLDDRCMMTDEDEDEDERMVAMVAMDSASIIPEAAMKCGILPIDSAEEDSLVLMSSGEGVLHSPSARSPDQHQQHQHQQQQQQQQQQLCVGCKRPITERYLLKVMDQFWHEDCLKCSCCDCRLGEVGSTLFTKANLLLCRRDYLRLFGATGCCSVCSKMIPAFEMVMKAKGNVYHLECFACQQCNHRFCIGDRYYLYDNKILCEFDYEERLVFARLSHGYNALSNIKRQAQSINSLPANNNCRSSNLNGC